MHLGLLILIALIVLLGGAAICVGWWKLADRFFPGVSRKTGQDLKLRREHQDPDPYAHARVIARKQRDRDEPQ